MEANARKRRPSGAIAGSIDDGTRNRLRVAYRSIALKACHAFAQPRRHITPAVYYRHDMDD